jgi:hypothetical protein
MNIPKRTLKGVTIIKNGFDFITETNSEEPPV